MPCLWSAQTATDGHIVHPFFDCSSEEMRTGRELQSSTASGGGEVSKSLPKVVTEVLEANGYTTEDIDLLIPHQANLRINQMAARTLGLREDQVFNNIQKYGNTTAASIPIALHEAVEAGLIKKGDLVVLAAFGAGLTWGANLIRW